MCPNPRIRFALASLLAFSLSFVPSAHAIDIDLYRPSSDGPFQMIQSSLAPDSIYLFTPSTTAQLGVLTSPLSRIDESGTVQVPIVSSITALYIGESMLVSPRVLLSADISLTMVDTAAPGTEIGASDLRLLSKIRVTDDDAWAAFSLIPTAYAPTGNPNDFVGNGVWGLGLSGALEKQVGWARIALNAGYVSFSQGTYETLDYRHELNLSAGVEADITPRLSASFEKQTVLLLSGSTLAGDNDFFLGAKYLASRDFALTVGAGLSGVAAGSQDSFRALIGFRFTPFSSDEPTVKVASAAPAPAPVVAAPVAPPAPVVTNNTNKTTTTSSTVVIYRQVRAPAGGSCRTRKVDLDFPARALTPEERSALRLPYASTGEHAMPELQIGEYNGLSDSGTPYVDESQVVFAVDVRGLPSRDAVIEIERADLKMETSELGAAAPADSQVLCLLHQGICSGELYRTGWKKSAISSEFFKDRETPNDAFLRQYRATEAGHVNGKTLYSVPMNLSIRKLIENVPDVSVSSILYGDQDTHGQTLYFSVADGVYVSRKTHLSIKIKEDPCHP